MLEPCTWIKVFNSWARSRGFHKEIYDYHPDESDVILQRFYMELRKASGEEYEPNCLLPVMMASLVCVCVCVCGGGGGGSWGGGGDGGVRGGV